MLLWRRGSILERNDEHYFLVVLLKLNVLERFWDIFYIGVSRSELSNYLILNFVIVIYDVICQGMYLLNVYVLLLS